jgi:hypothetical protein
VRTAISIALTFTKHSELAALEYICDLASKHFDSQETDKSSLIKAAVEIAERVKVLRALSIKIFNMEGNEE